MAWLHTVKVQALRNIEQAELTGLAQLNFFAGRNGAGKTSALEAVHLLGMGRSFRASRNKPLIAHEQPELVVFGDVHSGAERTEPGCTVGVRKGRDGQSEIRLGGQRANSSAELATLLPLQVINADTFQLILGAPGIRRQFLDWGVFHVEHGFLGLWRRLQRCLKQRNSLLRRGNIGPTELAPWDLELLELAEQVTAARQRYFEQWLPVVYAMLEKLWPGGMGLEFSFYSGWDRKLSFQQVLERQQDRDLTQGHTSLGPHRADMRIRLNGLAAGELLSRGQLKLLSSSMRLAQAALLGDRRCVFLVDDLPSELDEERRGLFCQLLVELGSQVFLTCIDPESLECPGFEGQDIAMFHVEHGVFTNNNG